MTALFSPSAVSPPLGLGLTHIVRVAAGVSKGGTPYVYPTLSAGLSASDGR
jgi:hypothetical protein